MRGYKFIKLAEIDAARMGNTTQYIEGYLVSKNFFDELKNCKIIFYFDLPIVNRQVIKMVKRVIPVNSYSIFFIFLKKALLFWKKNDHILELEKFSLQFLFNKSSCSKFNYNKPNLYFTEDEKKKGFELVKQLGIKSGDKWICIHNRDSLFLNKFFPHHDWSYHNYRDFSVNSLKSASEFFASKGYFVIRVGSFQKEKFVMKNPKIIDYANSNLRDDFLDIYLLANSEFYFGSSSGPMNVSFTFKKPCYGINYTLTDFTRSHAPWPFIFKRIKRLDDEKLLTLKEIFDSKFANVLRPNLFKDYNMTPIDNSIDEIKSLAVEVVKEMNGEPIEDDEDTKIQKKFWKIYCSCVKKKEFGSIKPKISPSFLRNNLDLLN